MATKREKIRKVAIVAKPHMEEAIAVVRALTRWLKRRHVEPRVEVRVAQRLDDRLPSFPWRNHSATCSSSSFSVVTGRSSRWREPWARGRSLSWE